MRMTKFAAAAVLALALVGCAGTSFSYDEARKVKVGMTEDEVTQIMGPPYSVVSRTDGQMWVCSHANGMTGARRVISFRMVDGKVVEVPAIVNQKGIQPVRVGSLPPKIMIEQILPDWLDTERELLAFKTGDRSALLYGVLHNHGTKNFEMAVSLLDDLMNMPEVQAVEDNAHMTRIADYYKKVPL